MKTLHWYLLRQVIGSLVMTMVVFTFVLLIGNVLREILPLLVNGQATFSMVARAIGLLIPFVLAFALPMAMLTSALLVFGRFSADQELTAARASGVSLLSLISPILIFSLLLCGVSAWMNMKVAPECRVAYDGLVSDVQAALASVKLPEGRYITFPGQKTNDPTSYTIYAGKNRNQNLQDVVMFQVRNETNTEAIVHAPSGHLDIDTTNHQLILTLQQPQMIIHGMPMGSRDEGTFVLDLNSSDKSNRKPRVSNMTFAELRQELRDLERRINLPLPVQKNSPDDSRNQKRLLQRQRNDVTEPVRVQIQRQVAFSLACFGFTLIGIPLGIRMHRRETNIGIAVALGLVFIYYMLLIVGDSLSARPEFAPHLLVWLPNFVFQSVGAVLLWRANRGI